MLIGIVGKANVGKSTLFKALTLAEVDIANYPFTTIAANEGVGFVEIDCIDKEFNVKCQPKHGYCSDSKRFVPVKLLDVAGLVPGAHEGKGRGNQFLDDLRQADAFIHIVDISGGTNEKGEQVEALSYDPANDVRFLEVELDMWYLGLIKKGWDVFAKTTQQNKEELHKALASHLTGLGIDEKLIENFIKGLPSNIKDWDEEILKKLASDLRKASKPMIIACNKIDVPGADKNFERLKNEFKDYILVACSAESELALREAAKHGLMKYIPGENNFEIIDEEKLSDKQKKALEFIKNNVLAKFGSTGAEEVLDDAVFKLLNYIPVYPVENENKLTDGEGNVLPDVHLLPEGSTTLDLAYRIHSDIGDKFKSAIDARTKKRLGKDHVLKDRDVVKIIV